MTVQVLETGERLYLDGDCIQSVLPPEFLFGFTYHSFMVPPFKPSNMLILGYGNGTISGLTKKIWGEDVKVLGVDKVEPEIRITGDTIVTMDAYKFITEYSEKYDKFDYIAIDLYDGDRICDFILRDAFIGKLKEVCSLRLAVNSNSRDCFENVDSVYCERFDVEVRKEIQGKNVVSFYKVRE